jgi:hypothetical protein
LTYGVTPQGFSRKPLAQIIAELEAANVATFGPAVIQSAESPLGQINGLMANLLAIEWEHAEDVYQSYDPDQAEDVRLDTLAKMRLLERATGESDASFRQAITNAGRARIDMQDLVRAVQGVSGVTYAQAFVNDGDAADANGVPGHSIAVAALGGADAALATTLRDYVVPGIGTFGNTRVDTTIDGFCRSIWIMRPTPVEIWLEVEVEVSNDRNGCPPPSSSALAVAIAQDLSGVGQPINGADVDEHMIRVPLAIRHPNVRIVSVTAGVEEGVLAPVPLTIAFDEIATFASERITVTVV